MEKCKVKQKFQFTMKEQGYIEVTHEDDILSASIENSEFTWEGKTYHTVPLLRVTKEEEIPCYIFEEEGIYNVVVKAKYEVGGETYQSEFKPEDFEVK